MVIVDIYGGLGNQMFQYAYGRSLSKRLNTNLKINYSYNLVRTDFDPNDITSIFDIFNVIEEKATKEEIKKFIPPIRSNSLIRFLYIIKYKLIKIFCIKYKVIKESHENSNRNIFYPSIHYYLYGYWQSEKYFIDYADLIRKDFEIKIKMNKVNFDFAKKIKSTESVSIHLRGRDYITKEEIKKVHFTCDEEYYERSINYIKNYLKNPHFFVFSDDHEWAKKILKIDSSFTFADFNTWNKNNYDDLRLMSQCKHNIIANSSFSWWGAWLNTNENKIVIAPKQWFANQHMNNQAQDLIPEKWIRL